MEDMKFSYRDPEALKPYLNDWGGIKPRSKTGLTVKQQRQLVIAVKRARHLALLPISKASAEAE